ncbi:hypothetical protein CcCBS67573_g09527 [Chytriomyces confervae]|uniref:Uncharacterized protein n=1 Tax=Chytriomyces confervae TaxID=246404 RepID=A0A507DV73_9FUNG|nr:hypothetical protein CcCBS67573_g09527 [Chytriomyces confervae]
MDPGPVAEFTGICAGQACHFEGLDSSKMPCVHDSGIHGLVRRRLANKYNRLSVYGYQQPPRRTLILVGSVLKFRRPCKSSEREPYDHPFAPLNMELPNTLNTCTRWHLRTSFLRRRLPDGIGTLSNLTSLFLDSNRLEGAVPTSFNYLVALQALKLSYNRFIGEFPALSNLSTVTRIDIIASLVRSRRALAVSAFSTK